MDKKTPKVPTEPLLFDDIWNGFKTDYLPFVEWQQHPDENFSWIVVEFEENSPKAYTNKWSREQFKIKVIQDTVSKMLSAGKMLFVRLKDFCEKEHKLPMDLGFVQINRIGSGFETTYQVLYYKKP